MNQEKKNGKFKLTGFGPKRRLLVISFFFLLIGGLFASAAVLGAVSFFPLRFNIFFSRKSPGSEHFLVLLNGFWRLLASAHRL